MKCYPSDDFISYIFQQIHYTNNEKTTAYKRSINDNRRGQTVLPPLSDIADFIQNF